MNDTQTPHKPSSNINFRHVNLGDIIRDISHQFDFDDIINDSSDIISIRKVTSANSNENCSINITNLNEKDKVYPEYIKTVLPTVFLFFT